MFSFFAQHCKESKAEIVFIDNNDIEINSTELLVDNKTATFEIKGMTCEMGCAKTIEKKLSNLDGISFAKVHFEEKTASLNFDSNKIDKDIIISIVESIGDMKTYKVENINIFLDQLQ